MKLNGLPLVAGGTVCVWYSSVGRKKEVNSGDECLTYCIKGGSSRW